MSDCLVWSQLECVLRKLSEVDKEGSLLVVRDDTLLHKLHSHVHTLLVRYKDAGQEFSQKGPLLRFIQAVLDPSLAANTSNSASVALAIRLLASLITVETSFATFEDSKVLSLFLVSLPRVRNEPSLASAALLLVMALIAHPDGLIWLVKNGIWEKMLLPCLHNPSIFVQREGINAITMFLVKLMDTEYFEGLVKDLCLLSEKFCELRIHLSTSKEAEEMFQSTLRVLNVFRQLYWQTLGKSAVYSKINCVNDMNLRLLPLLQSNISLNLATNVAELLILNLLHKFQEKLLNYGILEQFHLDSLCGDMIALIRLLVEKGYSEAFVRSSANVHKYWSCMTVNMKKEHNIDLSSGEALLHIVTTLQITSLLALYQFCLDTMKQKCPEKKEILECWRDEIHSHIKIKEEIKIEAGRLEKDMVDMFRRDYKDTIPIAITCINAITANTDYLNPVCAVTLFQGLSLMLWSEACNTSPIRHHIGLQRTVIDSLGLLIDRFNINWRKSYASVCLLGELCDVVLIPGLSTQVKVCIFKAMNTCISRFVPPVMSMLVNSGHLENNSVEQMGKVLAAYLGDVDWEVRDSVLEVLITCMKLAKEKYPHFVDWLLRHHLTSAIITAIGDVEGYVRASAFTVLAHIISIDKVWSELNNENLPHRALSAVLREEEAVVRRAALKLVQELFLAGKFSENEVGELVVRGVQRCAEDGDDEVRLAALDFIHAHTVWSLNKAGMVDGEFPSITFSRGKIIKLGSEEVKHRVVKVLTWVCECGYLCALLSCRRDLVSQVVVRARDLFCFFSDLVTKYHITQEDTSCNEDADGGKKTSLKTQQLSCVLTEPGKGESVERNNEMIVSHLDLIDKTINEILDSSALENVANIKRQGHSATAHTTYYTHPRKLALSIEDMPPPNPALPLTSLLQAFSTLCQPPCGSEGEKQQHTEIISLLDDILLEGQRQHIHLDDQRLRDCY